MNLAWHGRVDLPASTDTQRWHQGVAQDPRPGVRGIALLGFNAYQMLSLDLRSINHIFTDSFE